MSESHGDSSFADSIRSLNLGQVVEAQDLLEKISTNVGDFERHLTSVIEIKNRDQLQKLVLKANERQHPLYPFSKGFNWGYGSKLPAKNKGSLVDLSALNKIISIDEDYGIATIEPGVTQKQLADELLKLDSKFYLDVTGSGAQTSVLGNSLERGVAYGSLRVKQIVGIEVILGDGQLFRTGFGSYANSALEGLYSFGLGPSLEGLFFQSNFGIVVSGKIQLKKKPASMYAISVGIGGENLKTFVNCLSRLVADGFIQGIPHLADRQRTHSTLLPLIMTEGRISKVEANKVLQNVITQDWMLTASISGEKNETKEKLKHVSKVLGKFGRIFIHNFDVTSLSSKIKAKLIDSLVTKDQRLVLKAASQLRGFHHGKPSDAGIQFLLQNSSAEVDESSEGFLLCTPLAPLSGENAQFFWDTLVDQSKKHGVSMAMTLNLITPQVLEAVISVHYLRASKKAKQSAHESVGEMTSIFLEKGFYPYRINIDQQKMYGTLSPVKTKLIEKLKDVFDPNGIMSPGRYDGRI